MMKTYIKPNTNIHQIELTQMIAESGNTFTAAPTQLKLDNAGEATSGVNALGTCFPCRLSCREKKEDK